MKKLLSLPPNLVECFHDIMHADHKEWFCTSDPVGKKLGSGGGTAWLLNACREEEDKDAALGDWLAREKRILLHAGGQSRRLPGYAPSGKVLTPIPVFRWARGQRITQDLLSLQLPLYEEIYVGDYISKGKAGKLITPTFEINVGKWFTPVIGLRAGFGGYQAKGYSVKDAGFAYKRVDTNVYRTKWGILHLHGDVMLNFTNLFCGYREDRLYNAIPYVSIGYLRGIDNNENELSGGIGFINRFRLNKAWDLNLELKGNINNDVMDGIRGGKNMEGSAAIMVGATYRFNRRDWTKGTGISAAEMQAVQNQLKSMNEENASLRNRVNALEEEKRNQPVVTETKASNKLPDATEYVAFFDINKAYLSEKEAVNLEAYANLIKKYPENKFIITGYADKQTGSAEFNERLSKLRAEAVYNTLVDKYGVNKDQLTMEYKGGVDTMFRENPRLSRAAIIRMAK